MTALVQLQVRIAYGQTRIYPMNEHAFLLVALTGRKTFKESDLGLLTALGYQLEWMAQAPPTAEGGEA